MAMVRIEVFKVVLFEETLGWNSGHKGCRDALGNNCRENKASFRRACDGERWDPQG